MKAIQIMMKSVVVAVAAMVMGAAFGSTVYVKPEACGTGDGSSWSNAMGSVSNALIQALKTEGIHEVRMAKGIHKWTSAMQIGYNRHKIYDPAIDGSYAFAIRGGFAGESEDETADIAANPTYISCDVNGDDRWVKRSLSSLASTGNSTTTDCGLIVDGNEVVWPDDIEDADALYAPDEKKVSDNVAFLDLTDNRNVPAVEFSDFTFLGAGASGTFINTTGASGCTLKNITFLGPCVKSSLTAMKAPANTTTCENVKMLWAYAGAVIWGMGSLQNSTFKQFDVKGVYYNGNCQKGAIFSCGGDGISSGFTLKDSTFEKCYASQSYSYNAASIVFGFEKAAFGLTITNCVFRRICSRGNSVAAVLSSRAGGANTIRRYRVVDCLFEGNESYATDGTEVNNFGIVALSGEACSLEGCTFKDNTITVNPTGSAKAARAGVVTLVSPIDANETAAPHRLLVNCTFSGNTVVAADGSNDAEKTPRNFSRSVLVNSLAQGRPLDVVLAHCTFAGTASAEPDVAWDGLDTSCKVRVLNSIFNGPSSGYTPVASTASGVMTVENSLMNGVTSLPNGITGTDNVFSELPMGDWDDLEETRIAPVLRPAARFPALRSAAALNRFQKDNATYLTDADGAHVYNDASSITIPATVDPLMDAVGTAHPEGEATIGAMQTLTDAAENGATLHLSSSPAGAGSLTGGGSIQVVEKGVGVTTVTAVSSDPAKYTFTGWQNPDGSTYSTAETLTIDALNEDLQLTAVFTAPKTTYTFNLGAAGTFDENGQSSITKKLDAGATLTVPTFIIDEEHYQPVGWDVTPPQTVGMTDQEFDYITIEKLHRIIRVDCNLVEGGDGSTWERAMTNVQEAIDTAAQWTGEVWIRKGVHSFAKAQTDKLVMANNVQILGGFEGVDGQYEDVDAERAARDPKQFESVLSADINADDPWTKNGTAIGQKVIADGRLNYPDFEKGKVYYGMTIYYPNANYIFNNADAVLDETAVLDGVTLTSAITKNLNNGSNARPTVRNCKFIGNGAKSTTTLSVSNCTFLAISGSAAIEFAGGIESGTHGMVDGCTFRYCNGSGNKGVFTFSDNSDKKYFEIRDTLFEQCTSSRSLDIYGATVIGTEWGKGLISGTTVRNCWTTQGVLVSTPAGGCVITNCLFEGNSCVQNASGAAVSTGAIPYVMVRNAQPSASASYYNTTFRNNTVSRTVGDNANSKDGNAAILQSTANLLVANCTFDGNTVTCTSPLAAYPKKAAVLLAPAAAYCGVVHSTFNNNTAADGDVGFVARTGTAKSYIVNSVFADGTDQKYSSCTGNGAQAVFYNNVAATLKESDAVIATAESNRTESVQLTRAWQGVAPVVGRRAKGMYPAMDAGRNVYLDKGVICVPTDAGETAFVNPATGAAVTPSDDKQMLDDVLGMPRPQGHVTPGSVQALGSATMMFVR